MRISDWSSDVCSSDLITVAAGAALLAAFVGRWLKLADFSPAEEAGLDLADPEVELDITDRSGPIVIEIEYRVPRDRARAFYGVMQELQLSRQRNGAYGRSEEHTSELQSLMRISYAVFCL